MIPQENTSASGFLCLIEVAIGDDVLVSQNK